jgi:hypothetical protein
MRDFFRCSHVTQGYRSFAIGEREFDGFRRRPINVREDARLVLCAAARGPATHSLERGNNHSDERNRGIYAMEVAFNRPVIEDLRMGIKRYWNELFR